MFTLEQIDDIHSKFGKMDMLEQYLKALNVIGVCKVDSFLRDGHSEYLGEDGFTLASPPAHDILEVATASNASELLEQLRLHKQHKTNYLQMSKGLASSGVEKWTFDTNAMTLTYFDKTGNEMLIETIL